LYFPPHTFDNCFMYSFSASRLSSMGDVTYAVSTASTCHSSTHTRRAVTAAHTPGEPSQPHTHQESRHSRWFK
jgi:hypothetical protein